MSRIGAVFREGNRPAFIPYIVAGDPNQQMSIEIAKALIDAGANILEMGIPFSDPLADGPTLQRANNRALLAGMNTALVFETARRIQNYASVPIVLLTYYNLVLRYGIEQFYADAQASGVDGILVVDMPPEEADEIVPVARAWGIDQIFLVAPTTSEKRIASILRYATGYLYLVSTLGVTGARSELPEDALSMLSKVRACTDLPLAVGFGISSAEQVNILAAAGADAIIVGSALADIIEGNLRDRGNLTAEVSRYTGKLLGIQRK